MAADQNCTQPASSQSYTCTEAWSVTFHDLEPSALMRAGAAFGLMLLVFGVVAFFMLRRESGINRREAEAKKRRRP